MGSLFEKYGKIIERIVFCFTIRPIPSFLLMIFFIYEGCRINGRNFRSTQKYVQSFAMMSVWDTIDIICVAFLLYKLIGLLKNTKYNAGM